MLTLRVFQISDHIFLLRRLYEVSKAYPCDGGLHEHEISLTSTSPVEEGSFGSCWVGMFLGSHTVAMKTLRTRPGDNRADIVSSYEPSLNWFQYSDMVLHICSGFAAKQTSGNNSTIKIYFGLLAYIPSVTEPLWFHPGWRTEMRLPMSQLTQTQIA